MKVRKAIIPAAGFGTRLLPATKALPKEMLPIIDKPTIQYIVEEAIASGIEDILIISGRNKRIIEDHFDKSYELEDTLAKQNKDDLLEEVRNISNLATIHYVRQKDVTGLGDAVHHAKSFVGNEPFAVLLGDDLMKGEKPCLQQLIDVYNRYHTSVIAIQQVKQEEVSNYGMIKPKGEPIEENLINIDTVIEKPSQAKSPSCLAIMGRYVFRPELFDAMQHIKPDYSGEVQLTDAIQRLSKSKAIFGYIFQGKRYDIGNKFGFLQATIDFGLEHPSYRNKLREYIEEKMKEGLI
ncbi:UTP--glucose-1-phosphate uridylyltransferase GalU [Pontibacillus litoralis]|uniref:UTP--glucose-1-phosphate uridylyltransferase n=1 Tax=Pontibacillus litoralis JSM 072002 TaxID=1385512 RepID=A0A0A5G1T2_9BACI|nr:UTP--glucose-1-phosphate uridylyltransferase GalU [Pontibacillus litoralis]KGX87046.1 UTP--glucose-1-phosphate uridylyltransferase [Pontibacillus litoralis JSM 072002]